MQWMKQITQRNVMIVFLCKYLSKFREISAKKGCRIGYNSFTADLNFCNLLQSREV